MKYMFRLCVVVFTAFITVDLCGCISDGGLPEGGEPVAGSAVEFPTTISKTRAFDDKWEWGDDIGVYMIPAADPPERDWNTIELHAENKRYIHDMNEDDEPDNQVVFSGFDAANTILWPGSKQKFDVVAYYPWTASVNGGFLYPVDLSDQRSQKKIDLMWSNNVRGRSSGAPSLGFVHKLAKLVFNVTDTTGASLDGMTSTFIGLPTTASFDLAAGEIAAETEGGTEPFEGNLHSTGDNSGGDGVAESAIVEAIVLPGARPGGYTVTFGLKNGEQALFTVSAPLYEAGKRYVYNIGLTPPQREGATFGVEGDLEQITQWGDGDESSYPGNIPKTDPVAGGGLSAAWSTTGVPFASPVAVEGGYPSPSGDSYKVGGELVVTKPDCEGIASVTVSLTSSSAGASIRSVTVSGQSLVIDHDGNPGTPPTGSCTLPVISGTAADFTFRTADGKPCAGEVKIVIVPSGTTNLHGFGTNTDI